jgi:hypothetical protein
MKSVWQNLNSVLKDKIRRLWVLVSVYLCPCHWSFLASGEQFSSGHDCEWLLSGQPAVSNPEDFRNLLDKILPPGKFR